MAYYVYPATGSNQAGHQDQTEYPSYSSPYHSNTSNMLAVSPVAAAGNADPYLIPSPVAGVMASPLFDNHHSGEQEEGAGGHYSWEEEKSEVSVGAANHGESGMAQQNGTEENQLAQQHMYYGAAAPPASMHHQPPYMIAAAHPQAAFYHPQYAAAAGAAGAHFQPIMLVPVAPFPHAAYYGATAGGHDMWAAAAGGAPATSDYFHYPGGENTFQQHQDWTATNDTKNPKSTGKKDAAAAGSSPSRAKNVHSTPVKMLMNKKGGPAVSSSVDRQKRMTTPGGNNHSQLKAPPGLEEDLDGPPPGLDPPSPKKEEQHTSSSTSWRKVPAETSKKVEVKAPELSCYHDLQKEEVVLSWKQEAVSKKDSKAESSSGEQDSESSSTQQNHTKPFYSCTFPIALHPLSYMFQPIARVRGFEDANLKSVLSEIHDEVEVTVHISDFLLAQTLPSAKQDSKTKSKKLERNKELYSKRGFYHGNLQQCPVMVKVWAKNKETVVKAKWLLQKLMASMSKSVMNQSSNSSPKKNLNGADFDPNKVVWWYMESASNSSMNTPSTSHSGSKVGSKELHVQKSSKEVVEETSSSKNDSEHQNGAGSKNSGQANSTRSSKTCSGTTKNTDAISTALNFQMRTELHELERQWRKADYGSSYSNVYMRFVHETQNAQTVFDKSMQEVSAVSSKSSELLLISDLLSEMKPEAMLSSSASESSSSKRTSRAHFAGSKSSMAGSVTSASGAEEIEQRVRIEERAIAAGTKNSGSSDNMPKSNSASVLYHAVSKSKQMMMNLGVDQHMLVSTASEEEVLMQDEKYRSFSSCSETTSNHVV